MYVDLPLEYGYIVDIGGQMKKISVFVLIVVLLSGAGFARAGTDTWDVFRFFEEEAKVISASRIATAQKEAPATVYVVTSRDIKDSGAQTIWDALRGVPGVDVIQTKSGQAEVSIRGLSKSLNNRTLVMLDGKSVLTAYADIIVWETIPVTLQEIDRIEVLEGPASAVYGANAVNGIINIVTKTPEQFQGGELSYSTGERNARAASFDYGRRLDKWGYRVGAGVDGVNRFENSAQMGSRAGKFNAFADYAPSRERKFSIFAGMSEVNTQNSSDSVGDYFYRGETSYLETVYKAGPMKYRAYWNRAAIDMSQFVTIGSPNADSDTYLVGVERAFSPSGDNEALIGADYKYLTLRSPAIRSGGVKEDFFALYLEDKWTISDRWSLHGSGRLDKHPYTDAMVSPRASLVFSPADEHVLRLSAGTSFRNPSTAETFFDSVITFPNSGAAIANPPYTSLEFTMKGNTGLSPERMKTAELSYAGLFGDVTARTAVFCYKLKDMIYMGDRQTTGTTPPVYQAYSRYENTGDISAWGGELGLDMRLSSRVSSYANYSVQRLTDHPGPQLLSRQSPRNKVNAGLRAKGGGWTGDLQAHWTDNSRWKTTYNKAVPIPENLYIVRSYFLVNANAAYEFRGRLRGLRAALSVSNLFNEPHHEILPRISAALLGQSGEIMRRRWMGTVSYRF